MVSNETLQTIQILIVEDEIIVAEDLKEILEEFGYRIVDLVASAEEAIAKVPQLQPDLVLMDIRLKGKMDGVEAAEHIWRNYQIPIIYLTANSDISTLQRAKTTQPFGYITKPFKEKDLQTAIEIAIERYQLEKKLKEKEQWFTSLFKSLGDGVIATNKKSQVTLLNPAAETITGWKEFDALGKKSTEVFKIAHGESRVAIDCPVQRAIDSGMVASIPDQTILTRKNGAEVSIDDIAAPMRDEGGQIQGAVVVFRDITERKLSQRYAQTHHAVTRILAESRSIKATIPQLLQTISLGLQWDMGECWVLDRQANVLRYFTSWHLPSLEADKFIAQAKPLTFSSGVGLPGLAWKVGQPVWMSDIIKESNFLRSPIAIQSGLCSAFGVPILCESKLLSIMTFFGSKPDAPNEELLKLLATLSFQIGQFIERKLSEAALQKSQKRLAWQASHDPLTGLLNRRSFEQHLQAALSKAKSKNQHHALCYLDLDRFKIVNDSCGHKAGDELLREVTALLKEQIRTTDLLARLGGDEFAVLLPNCPPHQALSIANALRQSLEEFRFVWGDKMFTIGVSIGLVKIDGNIPDLACAMNAADAACYVAKNTGRNRVHFYQGDDGEATQHKGQIQWVEKLTKALEEDRFCLYYQKIIPLAFKEVNQDEPEHYEVLLRLQDETGSLISPTAFMPAAERYHLMQQIDRWVIRTLFEYLEKRNSTNLDDYHNPSDRSVYAINLSGASINDEHFIDFVTQQFATSQVPPHLICFEITETIAITNLAKAKKLIQSLKNLGCRFALDDFGSGMSCFAYLRNLPVDYLKIDGGFIKQILDNPTDLALTNAINHIGHVMGLQTIAEFVENDEILTKIREIGVDYAQGYGIGKPSPLFS